MLELLALIFLGLEPIYGGVILVKECPGIANHASDLSVDFSDCDTGSSNCTLLSGNTYYLKTTFSPWVDGNDLRVRSMSQMGVLGVPQGPGRLLCPEVVTLDGEGCDPSTGLKPGRVYTHINTFHVRRMFPEMLMKVRVEYFTKSFSTKEKKIKICFEVPVKTLKLSGDASLNTTFTLPENENGLD